MRFLGCVLWLFAMTSPALTEQPTASHAPSRRFQRLAIGVVVANFLLIATHGGDFYPFSRFPMFSRAGRPWTVALVRSVTPEEAQQPLGAVEESALPGQPFPIHRHHINQDDLSAVIRPMKAPLTPEQTAFLAQYFQSVRGNAQLVLYRAEGKRAKQGGGVEVRFQPLAVMGPEGVRGLPAPVVPEVGAP